MEKNNERLLSVNEIAEKLGLCSQSVRTLMRNPDFPSFKLGKKYCVKEKDFNAWFENLAGKEITLNSKTSEKTEN